MEDIEEFDIGMSMRGFIELLRAQWHPKDIGTSYKKTGMFSWEEPYGKNSVRTLYLGGMSRVSQDRRKCKLFEHIYWHPRIRLLLPGRSKWVMTLHITRIEGEPLHVELSCREPRIKDTMFQHCVLELRKLEKKYPARGWSTAQMLAQHTESEVLASDHVAEASQDRESSATEPAAPLPTEDAWTRIPDVGWDRQALEHWWNGYEVPQIADRLHLSQKTVRNRLSALRKIHTEEIVPTAEQLRKMGLR